MWPTGQIPITALLTGACLHDSQVAIPLMTLTSQRVTYLYDLMDAAYDAHAIDARSRSLGHIPLIALNGATPPISKLQQDSLRRYQKVAITVASIPMQQDNCVGLAIRQ